MFNIRKCSENYLKNQLDVYVNIIKNEPNLSLTVSQLFKFNPITGSTVNESNIYIYIYIYI